MSEVLGSALCEIGPSRMYVNAMLTGRRTADIKMIFNILVSVVSNKIVTDKASVIIPFIM